MVKIEWTDDFTILDIILLTLYFLLLLELMFSK